MVKKNKKTVTFSISDVKSYVIEYKDGITESYKEQEKVENIKVGF